MEPLDIPVRDPKEDLWHREMARRSQDTIRVYNPTDKDFPIFWHPNLRFNVRSKSTADVPRYVAMKYCRDMVTHLINTKGEEKGKELIEVRRKEGKPEFLDKWEENVAIWNKVPKTNDEKEIRSLYPQLWVGLVNEYGKDTNWAEEQERQMDTRTSEEKALQDLEGRRVSDTQPAPQPVLDTKIPVTPAPVISSANTCAVCQREFSSPLALSGHSRSHKKELEAEIADNS